MEINKIVLSNCLDGMKLLPDNSLDCCVTDPPYGIAFMNRKWDYELPSVEIWKEVLRVLKPGAHLLCACGTRTQHRMAVNIEDAGFEIRDVITWHYGSGFPKSMDLGKQMDKSAGATREVISTGRIDNRLRPGNDVNKTGNYKRQDTEIYTHTKTAPSTDNAKEFDGQGTALKPATEFWTLARKPIEEKTIAGNALKHGVGGLNIDACRITASGPWTRLTGKNTGLNGEFLKGKKEIPRESHNDGRFPANVVFDPFTAELLDEQSGLLKSGASRPQDHVKQNKIFGVYNKASVNSFEANEGGASRFFYIAKPSPSERGAHNLHPTVKPLELMQYLIRLVCPVDGLVLEPFAGSGTTCIAARKEDKRFIAFEMNADYIKIAEKRLRDELGLFL